MKMCRALLILPLAMGMIFCGSCHRRPAAAVTASGLNADEIQAIAAACQAGTEAVIKLWNGKFTPLASDQYHPSLGFIRVLTEQKQDAQAFDLLATLPYDGLNGMKSKLIAQFYATCSLDFVAAMEPGGRYPTKEEMYFFETGVGDHVFASPLPHPTPAALMASAANARDSFVREVCLRRAAAYVKTPAELAALFEAAKGSATLDIISGNAFTSMQNMKITRAYTEDPTQPEPVRRVAAATIARWLDLEARGVSKLPL